MDKIEKIRAEIERLYDGEAPKHDQQCDFDDGYFTGISTISNFLDTLSEEPNKSLDEAAEEYAIPLDLSNFEKGEPLFNCYDMADAFKSGAEWQKEQIMKGAVESEVVEDYIAGNGKSYGYIYTDLICLDDCGLENRQEVKIIIVKED